MAKKKLSTESVWLVLDKASGKVLYDDSSRSTARECARMFREDGRSVTVKSGEIQTFVFTQSKG